MPFTESQVAQHNRALYPGKKPMIMGHRPRYVWVPAKHTQRVHAFDMGVTWALKGLPYYDVGAYGYTILVVGTLRVSASGDSQ